MKLAEALSIRKDLQTRISQLSTRLLSNVRIQEGDEPAEDPKDLLKELDSCLKQLEEYIYRINLTNMRTMSGEKSLTQLLAERDVLTKRVSVMQEVFKQASSSSERYSRSEIKFVTTVDVKALRKQIHASFIKISINPIARHLSGIVGCG